MSEVLFDKIVEKIKNTKGLTKKTSERLLSDLIMSKNKLEEFIDQLILLKEHISICKICGYLSEDKQCLVCDLQKRNTDSICVVSSILDAKNIETINKYKGVYHILNGEINLNRNITPDKLNVNKLLERINSNSEVILALNATFEGELTANYLNKLLSEQNIKVTRLAKGIPMGASLDYMDEYTLENAFNNRKKYGE
ncbi:recombination protein RecR [Mycoplasma putrefaciens]|uniref:Recombination protein RecR n=1 Tax=Mycoplasma putrefaciens (strain ATCC 15718 / NCTC 10155 / C30 KS-1 / KS-1) TaxID=743965 RepID=A0A7U3ZT34_MYCPK|nr:recombination mediator RecR [Mycoplasma putrefaciens]AEM69051.1 recombination protein RecR [Mycoplasma putrefaciens KS1]SYV96659.1 recombination protein RecR [Mycoplasma putrefaciens]